jgi:NADH-quinone oxidoreductase subunit D
MAVETYKKLRKENMMLNVGPSHPAMHGIVRMMVELDGETVVKSDVEIGFCIVLLKKTPSNLVIFR